jgi:hypothetical protein
MVHSRRSCGDETFMLRYLLPARANRYFHGQILFLMSMLLLAACGPNLSALDGPATLYITNFALTGAQSGYAVGLQPGQKRAVLLDEVAGNWQRDTNPPPTRQGEALTCLTIVGDTLWIGGSLTDAQQGDATTVNGFVFHRDKTGTWQRQTLSAAIHAITFVDSNDGWAAGASGAIYHYSNGQWEQSPNDMQYDLFGIAFRSPTDGWAVGDHGTFIHYDGTGWQHIDHFTHETIYGIALTADDGWAVGTEGTQIHLVNGKWIEIAAPINTDNHAVAIAPDGDTWIAGSHGAVFHLHADTQQWEHIPPPGDWQINAIAINPNGTVWVGGNFDQTKLFAYSKDAWISGTPTM